MGTVMLPTSTSPGPVFEPLYGFQPKAAELSGMGTPTVGASVVGVGAGVLVVPPAGTVVGAPGRVDSMASLRSAEGADVSAQLATSNIAVRASTGARPGRRVRRRGADRGGMASEPIGGVAQV